MSDTRDPETDQQLPVINDNEAVQDMVIADVQKRKELGLKKYGTLLQAGNGRDMLQDAYEEALDLCIYLRGALEEQRLAREDVEAAVAPSPQMTLQEIVAGADKLFASAAVNLDELMALVTSHTESGRSSMPIYCHDVAELAVAWNMLKIVVTICQGGEK